MARVVLLSSRFIAFCISSSLLCMAGTVSAYLTAVKGGLLAAFDNIVASLEC
jgi:hypothetical protein